MIRSMVFSEGRKVGQDLEPDALRLVRSDGGLVLWVDLENPTHEETVFILEDVFHFHPLSIEDCMHFRQLPKLEDYEEYAFLIFHAVDFTRTDKFSTNKLDLFMGKEYLVTHHTNPMEACRLVRERFQNKMAPTARGGDRLAHMVLDAMVQQFSPVLIELTEELDELEETILTAKKADCMQDLLDLRKELSDFRQILRPQRELIHRLARGENKLIRTKLLPYYRDLHDSLSRIDETAMSYNERLMLDFDVYQNRTANEANEGIKVLTSLTALTLPPMIIGGWYGMNFRFMPELEYRYAYWIVLGITVVLIVAMAIWLKLKRWF